jgi:hypothetical protein
VPTNTPVPTSTNTPLPTDTPVPSCSNVSMVWKNIAGKNVMFTIMNNNSGSISLTNIDFTWPAGTSDLEKITLGNDLWSGSASSPFSVGVSGPLAAATSKDLKFQFGSSGLPDSGYSLTVSVDIGCVLTVNH